MVEQKIVRSAFKQGAKDGSILKTELHARNPRAESFSPVKKYQGNPKTVFERARTSILHEDEKPEWIKY